ncbi:MAG: hypothetical protein V7752_16930 [Halopseudomonas sp.]
MIKKAVVIALSSSVLLTSSYSLAANVDAAVAKKAAIVSKLHKKAKKALVNAAQDKSYADFVAASKNDRPQLQGRVDTVSLNVQKKFQVEEMCLIDANGPELARIVGQEIANDLSPDESGAVFFKPGFDAKPRTVHVSPVYMSPDANKWVLAYVSPIVVDGDKKAILHYEHGLAVFQDALNKGVKGERMIAVSDEGYVISDSSAAIGIDKVGDTEQQADYFKPFSFGGMDLAGVTAALDSKQALTHEGKSYAGAYKKVGNWTLLAFE